MGAEKMASAFRKLACRSGGFVGDAEPSRNLTHSEKTVTADRSFTLGP